MPTLNEEEGIRDCIRAVVNAVEEMGIAAEVVVSDSSTDRTPEIAREMGARVVEPDEPGYGYAYKYAFERVRGEYVVMGDADTTYDFEQLPRLLEPVVDGDADLVLGSRFDGEIKDGAMPALHQYVGNPLLTQFLNLFYDTDVSDAHSGFRAFSTDVLDELDLWSDGMEFASEMVMVAGSRDFDIREVPIVYHDRKGEATLNSFEDGWRHVKFMLVNAPGYLFLLPALGMGLLGLSLVAFGYFDAQIAGQWFGINSMIAGSLLTLVGYQVGSFGLLTDIVADPIRRPSGGLTRRFRETFTLERGIMLGVGLFAVGSVYAGWLVYQWIGSGYANLPSVSEDIVAFTLIVLGIQTAFVSFFASVLDGLRKDR